MSKQQPEAEPAGKQEFPAPDSEAGLPWRDRWVFLLFGASLAGPFIAGTPGEYDELLMVKVLVLIAIVVYGVANQLVRLDGFRLRAASVDGDGLRLEYRSRAQVVTWGNVGHLRIWTGKRGRLSEIGIGLRNGAAVIVRDLSDMQGLRVELESRTGLESKRAGGCLAALTTDRGFGILMYMLALAAHAYAYVCLSKSVYGCTAIPLSTPLVCLGAMLLFVSSVFVLTGHIPTHWARPVPPKLWRCLLAKRPIVRGVLAALLLFCDVLLIGLSTRVV